jgi:hypothetical protein
MFFLDGCAFFYVSIMIFNDIESPPPAESWERGLVFLLPDLTDSVGLDLMVPK